MEVVQKEKVMDEPSQEVLCEEADEIIKSRIDSISRNYPRIRAAYQSRYDWPEMDALRFEICLCLFFGLPQAAITLTNHFLESLLKYSLISHEQKSSNKSDEKKSIHSIKEFNAKFDSAREKYMSAYLGNNIDTACSKGLISKEQKKELHEFRERFRNAYSHSDKDKTFGEQRIRGQHFHFEGDQLIAEQPEVAKLSDFIIAQGIAQAKQAKNDAVPYFLYIDELAREIRIKLFGKIE